MRKIITYGGYFEAFMESLTSDQRKKVQYGLLLLKTENRLPQRFVKHIQDGLFELRTEYEGNIFRTFFIFDRGNLIVLFTKHVIEKALRIMEEYYDRTRK
ncbi:MAG: type II toxin-antitoxin system RelE/ParE family toxin [Bacteroidales bacterium]|nr:type II toxin-antitoxin system RelE/ParE family toxin [Bacteroidales bacterium]